MLVSLVLGLKHSCPWPREGLSSEELSLALASDFFCVLGHEPCVLDSTSAQFSNYEFTTPMCPGVVFVISFVLFCVFLLWIVMFVWLASFCQKMSAL